MKRRDLFKQASAFMLGTSAVPASALLGSPVAPRAASGTKDLVVTFAGPFCFWTGSDYSKVVAPPVGPNYEHAPHQPWIGTSSNEISIFTEGTPLDLTLKIDGYTPPQSWPTPTGTSGFTYTEGTGQGIPPLFTLYLPIPNAVIGVRPTVVMMKCSSGDQPYCKQWTKFATGFTLVYQNVGLDGVHIQSGTEDYFKPCFKNDESLSSATLGIHLTPMYHRTDPNHTHAKIVWKQMLAMYPWIAINGIEFCPDFNPAICDFDPSLCGPGAKHSGEKSGKQPGRVIVGPGNDCEIVNMLIESDDRRKRKP